MCALDDRLGRDLADKGAVLDAPVGGMAFPSIERLAVEDGLETRLVAVDGLRASALLRRVRAPARTAESSAAAPQVHSWRPRIPREESQRTHADVPKSAHVSIRSSSPSPLRPSSGRA